MSNPMMDALAAAAARNGGGIVPMPSQAQREEVAKVQGMQVRTNALAFALQLITARSYDYDDWQALADEIAAYIEDGTLEPPGPSPLRPRG